VFAVIFLRRFSCPFHERLIWGWHHGWVNPWKQTVYCVLRYDRLPSVPGALTRAIECLKTRRGGYQATVGVPDSQITVPSTVSTERELALLQAVRHAARQYRRSQQALADHETREGQEDTFRALLQEVRLSHGRLDAALLEIELYYEASGRTDD
jgi:hypothetical protein